MRYASPALLALAVTGLALLPLRSAAAQVRTIDEGTFVILKNGTPVGRESFRIVRAPGASGDVYKATGQLAIGDQRIAPSLSVDSVGVPITYDVAVQQGSGAATRLQARARPGRFSAMLRTPSGESTKEYVVPATMVVLDDAIAHQLFFVTLGGRQSGPVTVIDPRSNTQSAATLERRGSSSVDVGGRAQPATLFVLKGPSIPRREFWLDGSGRVLRMSLPDQGLVAVRDELPR